MIYRISTFLVFCFLKLFCAFEIAGRENIPPKGPFILASNHLSNLDPPVLAAACPCSICFLAKEELFNNIFVNLYFKAVGALPLNRAGADIKALRTALEVLKTRPLLVFPQGTRRVDFYNVHSGVGFLAKKMKVPVIAARIYGTDKVLGKGQKFPRPGKIRVIFQRVDGLEFGNSKEALTDKIVSTIQSL